jgi:hypothetical protein
MLISELYDLILEEHGQYVPDSIEFTTKYLKTSLEKHVLPIIGQYRPMIRNTFIQLTNSPYIFTESGDTYIPDWVSDVGIAMSNVATSIASVLPLMYREDHRTRLWYYEKPKLWTFMFGLLSVQGCVSPSLEASGNDWDIININPKGQLYLVDLAAGHLLVSIGKARRMVNFPDFPITTDAATMVEEGQVLIDRTVEELKRDSEWYLSV